MRMGTGLAKCEFVSTKKQDVIIHVKVDEKHDINPRGFKIYSNVFLAGYWYLRYLFRFHFPSFSYSAQQKQLHYNVTDIH